MSTTTDLPPVQKAPEKHGEKSHQSSQTTLDVHPTKPDFNSGLNLGIKGAIANAQLSVDKNFGDLSFTEPGSDHATDRAQTQLYRYTDLITRKSADAGQKVVDGTGHGGAGSDATCKPAADAAENKSCDNNQKESDKKK